MKTGIELIAEERQRQISVEGWTADHDEEHDIMQLSSAAGCYIANAHNKWFYEHTHTSRETTTKFVVADETGDKLKWVDGWPWVKEWDKRKKHDTMKSLIIAGALLAAEIDRLNALNDDN
jgi:hypothetical protein